MNIVPLKNSDIKIGKAVDTSAAGDEPGSIATIGNLAPFIDKCPLWTYILAEAAHHKIKVKIPVTEDQSIGTPQLGPVGGRIVAEVLLGLMFGDNDSFLSADPNWTPTIRGKGAKFALRDIVAYALGK
jgi:hypothetical protein